MNAQIECVNVFEINIFVVVFSSETCDALCIQSALRLLWRFDILHKYVPVMLYWFNVKLFDILIIRFDIDCEVWKWWRWIECWIRFGCTFATKIIRIYWPTDIRHYIAFRHKIMCWSKCWFILTLNGPCTWRLSNSANTLF